MYTALDMMMVDPVYQRMGAGRMLVRWGLVEAEKMGVDVSIRRRTLGACQLTCTGCC
jgi:predicted N-acetyltransferase YhbS